MREWRAVNEPYSAYDVSDDGLVQRNGKTLSPITDRYGYHYVSLYSDGVARQAKIHRLVCTAFHGDAPDGSEVCHLDGVRTNNAVSNLIWGSRSDNVQHAISHGTHKFRTPSSATMRRGAANPHAKLTESIVREARALHADGVSGRQLAKRYGVTSANMSAALRGQTWAHVGSADAPKGITTNDTLSPSEDR